MSDPSHTEIKELFFQASRLEPEDRRRFVDRLDEEERAEVLSLLDFHDETRTPATVGLEEDQQQERPAGPSRIPRISGYDLLRSLGEGGMGEVYEALQLRPVRRSVAIKVLKLESLRGEMTARFDSERQLLALVHHPNIATVFDAGTTAEGRPYFAMELVQAGVPITEYCDRERLEVESRLDLVIQICEAVQHAHQKGIVHRDLKPGNVLVTELDGRPLPKVIDFGIAKLVGAPVDEGLARGMVQTAHGQFFGTPAYMSPEQLKDSVDIDTRSDVYSLGLLLYEILVGRLPFEGDTLDEGLEALRKKRQGEPVPSPSSRLTRLGADAEMIARARRSSAAELARRLRGDLDWIIQKALENDRDRRYPAVSDLAADLRRHLDHLPVAAGPPSVIYRLRKLARRHRVGVAAFGFGLLALVLGSIGTTVGLVRSQEAEAEARREARTAREVSSFLVDLFRVSEPSEALGNSITAREILDRGAAKIEEGLDEEPLVKAELLSTIGTVYRSLGLYDEALPLLQEALELRRGLLGGDHAAVAASLEQLGILLHDLGRPQEARPLLEEAVRIRTELYGADHPAVARALSNLAYLYWNGLGDYEKAQELQERALEIREATLPADDPTIGESLTALGGLYFQVGDLAQARLHFRRAVDFGEEHLGALHPDLAASLNNLAMVTIREGNYDEALRLLERAVEIQEKVYGPQHPDFAIALNNLGYIHLYAGNDEAAEPILERAILLMEESLGKEHPELARALLNLGRLLTDRGELAAARPHLERALAIQEKVLGPESLDIGWILRAFGYLAEAEGNLEEATEHYRRALGIQQPALGPDSPTVLVTLDNLGRTLLKTGRVEEAEDFLLRSAQGFDRLNQDGTFDLNEAQALFDLGSLRDHQGRPREAREAYRDALALRRSHLDPEAGPIAEVEDRLAALESP